MRYSLTVHPNVDERLGQELVDPLLRRLLWAISIAASLVTVVSAVFGVTRIVVAALANAVIAAAMMLLVRRGWIFAASLIESLVLTASTIYSLTSGYGLLDISILILPSLYLLTSVLLSGYWILIVVVTTNLTLAVIGLAEVWGWLVTPNSRLVQYDDIIDAIILSSTMAAFVQYLISTLRRSIISARSAQARTRDILDATSDAIVIHDAKDGRITEVNETTLKMFGCTREELLSYAPGEARAGGSIDYVEQAVPYVRQAVAEGPQSFEWLAHDKRGNEFWVEAMLRAAKVGDEPCVVAVLRDITLRRRLEQRVTETEKLRAVGQLAGGIAHDFNNQLVGIFGHAEFLLSAAGDNEELRSCADSILASGQRAADLTRQLLAFARRGRNQNLPVDLHQLVNEVTKLARRSIDKRIVIERHLDASCATTVGDASALQNALLNLLLNARDSMPSGGTIRFVSRNVEIAPGDGADQVNSALPPGKYIEVNVTDTGTGIEPNILPKIFEPFFTTKHSGTGMGLAAVQGTMLEHQGAVEVVSKVGRGSTFRLLLPVGNEPSPNAPTRPPLRSQTQYNGSVLVVDDEATVISVVRLALERAGYMVTCCSEGYEALEVCKQQQFDLTLLDVMMPDLDGVELLRRLRASAPRAKVMIMTGHAPENVQARLREFPDVAVIPKPFLPQELVEQVQSALGRPRIAAH